MRAHDPISLRAPDYRRPGYVVFLALASAFALEPAWVSVQAQDEASLPARPLSTSDKSLPIDLSATTARVWGTGSLQWLYLVGKVAVKQGKTEVLGDEALVRVEIQTSGSKTNYRLTIYSESSARAPARDPVGKRSTTLVLETSRDPRIHPERPDGFTRLPSAPTQLAILGRSGLQPSTGKDEKASRSQVESSGASAPGTSRPVEPSVVPAQYRTPRGEAGADDPPAGGVPVTPENILPSPLEMEPPPPADGPILPSPLDTGPILERSPLVPTLPGEPRVVAPPTELDPLPESTLPPGGRVTVPGNRADPVPGGVPFLPDTMRVTRINPRNGGPDFQIRKLPDADGYETFLIVGGVNIVTSSPQFGIIDISADNVIIWRKLSKQGKGAVVLEDASQADDAREPLEFYLEGNVVVYQDEQKAAGPSDQRTYRAAQAYYEVSSERAVFLDAEFNVFAPGLVAPARVVTPRVDQFKPLIRDANGNLVPGLAQIRAEKTMSTGSRFPDPGYKIRSRSVDAFRVASKKRREPISNRPIPPSDPNAPVTNADLTWQLDMRQNLFYMGPLPFLYWPRIVVTADDFEPPLRQFIFRTNNYFGQQLLTDWNGYRLLGIRKPLNIDLWNVDVDYLSRRTKNFPALGSEIGWNGRDLINDFADPYGAIKGETPSRLYDYAGYFDVWGLKDSATDVLGSGPAIVTNNPKAANIGIQRISDPAYVDWRSTKTSATCSGSCPTTKNIFTRIFEARSRSVTPRTATFWKSITSGSSTWAPTRRPSPT